MKVFAIENEVLDQLRVWNGDEEQKEQRPCWLGLKHFYSDSYA